MEVVEYRKEYKDAFIDLNLAWIEKYFAVEAEDKEVLYHAERFIERGAMIYFAVEDDRVLATCMAMPMGGDTWEICKLAASECARGRGAGSAVFQACMGYAKEHGAKKLILFTNHILKPALHIYEKFGFRSVPIQPNEYARTDLQYEFTC